jgi:Flp pilus assembly protein protease CpaA
VTLYLGRTPISAIPLFFRVAITLWLLTIAYVDARTATISNQLTLPAMALLGAWRVLRVAAYVLNAVITRLGRPPSGWVQRLFADQQALAALLFMSLAWGFCFALWELHVLGGGDAKTLMGIFGLFPTSDFAVFLAAAVLILSLPLLLLRLRGRRLRDIPGAIGQRLQEGTLFPTQRELEEEGQPYAWTFCVPGVVFLWFLW